MSDADQPVRATNPIDETHDRARMSWVESANGHRDFPIQNLPFGIFSRGDALRGGVAIGSKILDLAALAGSGLLAGDALRGASAASASSLNAFLALDAAPRRALRRRLSELLSDAAHRKSVDAMLYDAADCTLHLPACIGDYTDFYVGIHHATNVGRLFRPDNPLLPNYKFVPIGYHGRASSVRASGAPVQRPLGQIKPADPAPPRLGPTQRLDYELELGVWIGTGNAPGAPVPVGRAADHIAGLSLLNDWSARDFQAWEYQPLGPFLAKNFHTTISPWIVTSEALAPFRVAQPPRPEGDPAPLPYLLDDADQKQGSFSIMLEVFLSTERMRAENLPPLRLSSGTTASMYWTISQLVAHHTINGCNLRPGDLLGTGTLSMPERTGFGSLIELSRGGADPIGLPTGETRTFLEDGDLVTIRGSAETPGRVSIGFGECSGLVRPAIAC